jgi:hypothetical protein
MARYAVAQHFFADSGIDLSEVSVIVGGVPQYVDTYSGFVVEDTIYLPPEKCVGTDVLVHELVHVWQQQTGWMRKHVFQVTWAFIADYLNGRNMYDYGGTGGLQAARLRNPNATITEAFGVEEQAVIVQHYLQIQCLEILLANANLTNLSVEETQPYQLLRNFAHDVIRSDAGTLDAETIMNDNTWCGIL